MLDLLRPKLNACLVIVPYFSVGFIYSFSWAMRFCAIGGVAQVEAK
jgi:hypothetical protein